MKLSDWLLNRAAKPSMLNLRRLNFIASNFTVVSFAALSFTALSLTMLTGCNDPNSGRAGVAYIEDEEGNLTELDNLRPAERTLPGETTAGGDHSTTTGEGSGTATPAATHGAAEIPVSDSATAATAPGAGEEWLTKFQLTERSGKLVGSEELKGQPYVVGFFFTSCPTICPMQNEKVRQLATKFSGKPVRFVSISCDPEVDTPEVLTSYAERFEADKDQWLFLTGDLNYIRRVGAEFFKMGIVRYVHPEKFALMDAEGKPYGYYTWTDANQWKALQADIEKLISK